MSAEESRATFECFGGLCTVLVSGSGRDMCAEQAVADARARLGEWHERFSRFLPDSELSTLNSDLRETVPVTPLMARLAQAAVDACKLTDGLVDATLLGGIERAGYTHDLTEPIPLEHALASAPPRAPARRATAPGCLALEVDMDALTVTRPAGVALDSGGLAKGLFADVLAEALATHDAFAIGCAGDLAIGGARAPLRAVNVESPFDGSILHTFRLPHGGVATSGIGRRSWLDRDGRPAHHLLDPSTAQPAFTGIVQVTALAPNALMAEVLAKAALLSGPQAAPCRLAHGGVIVFEDRSHLVVEPPPSVTLDQLAPFRARQSAANAG